MILVIRWKEDFLKYVMFCIVASELLPTGNAWVCGTTTPKPTTTTNAPPTAQPAVVRTTAAPPKIKKPPPVGAPIRLPYAKIGCFKDTGTRAIRPIEGDPILDGNYHKRRNAIVKCYHAAKKRGFKVFALQDGGWCASSATAEKTFNRYGPSTKCRPEGEGGPWANEVYYIIDYRPVGCFRDKGRRAIVPLEGKDRLLNGPYHLRKNAITKCAVAATKAGYTMFGLQNGGWCAASSSAPLTFDKYGKSRACKADGEGGPWANAVYALPEPYETVGCFRDRGNRAIPILEGKDPSLVGNYKARKHAIEKCYLVAKKREYKVFAVQNGGQCAGSATAERTFNKHGKSSRCGRSGKGGSWANQVYYIKDYRRVGCYKDKPKRAILPLEGKHAVLDGRYRLRKNAIAKCAVAARKAGYSMFALQNGGWCAASFSAPITYDKYGKSYACKADGEGGPWANEVYALPEPYETVGCFRDRGNRAIPIIEGKDPSLVGNYKARKHAIEKCYLVAKKRGYKVFAVQNGGQCAGSATAERTFNKHGKSSRCGRSGKGGSWANQVYYIKDYERVGCYQDRGHRAIATLEGKDAILDGPYHLRKHVVAKCAVAARKAGYKMFALQDGGWCAASASAPRTYRKYGKSRACHADGEGGPWANEVYRLK